MKTFRLIFLGAGFSRAANLPLGSELFIKVRHLISSKYGRDNIVERDLVLFLEYLNKCERKQETAKSINYEEFLEYLDIEHFLGLKGGDTWSSEGNESQLLIRKAIAEILYDLTPKSPPNLYKKFVKRLNPDDWLYTFNYDTLLESALDFEGIPFRLFPFRYSEVGNSSCTIDNSKSEIVLLKLHGSINWFDRTSYDERVNIGNKSPMPYIPDHHIFGPNRITESTPLTEGLRPDNDSLSSIFIVKDIGPLIKPGFWECTPLILSPSKTKLFYSGPLRDFWWGIQRAGGLNLSAGVIGYSLPRYDLYARQVLYKIYNNYVGYEPDFEISGRRKAKFRILDYRQTAATAKEFMDDYQFIDPGRTDVRLDGLNEDSVEWFLK